VEKDQRATKPRKGSIAHLVVNLRCSWCKQLFPWKPRWKKHIEERLPRTCSLHCEGRLREWEWNRKISRVN
jgi:hypothetical protein